MNFTPGDLTRAAEDDDPTRSVDVARRVLGECFDPVAIGVVEPSEPELDLAVDELRRIRDAIAGIAGSAVRLDDVSEKLREAADLLESRVPDPRDRLKTLWEGDGNRRTNPVGGMENPIAPPLRVFGRNDGAVYGELVLGPAYQGPPGCVHGGVSSLIIDHLMGFANAWAGRYGMTAHYELDYRSPTPLLEPLLFTCWVDEFDGRKTWTRATIHTRDRLCVEAHALFLQAAIPIPGKDSARSIVGDGGI